MDKIIKELWYGNIDPIEAVGSGGPRYKELLTLIAQNRETLLEKLDGDLQSMLEKYDEGIHELNAISEMEAFAYGFRLGVRLMAAVMKND